MNNFVRRCKKVFCKGGVKELLLWILVSKNVGRIIPNKAFIELEFRLRMGEKLKLDTPKTFNEKLQWLKLYDQNSNYIQMVDKCDAKKYVSNILGEEYIIPTLGVWNSFDEINFNELPNRFVLKCTHDSGSVVICRDKKCFDFENARKKICKALQRNAYWYSREWQYKHIKPRVIAEEYMEDSSGMCLKDYKFYCFNGKPHFLYLSEGLENHATAHISYVSLEWEKAPFIRLDYVPFEVLPDKPINFNKMKKFAEKLSDGLAFSRIDLYEINKQIYFSEITFFPAGGFAPFHPKEWDEKIGDWLELPKEKKYIRK